MAVDSVRRLTRAPPHESLPSSEIANFQILNSEERVAVDLLGEHSEYYENYSFADQECEYRQFEFTTEPLFGSPKTANGILEYRKDSRLLFVILDQDTPSPSTIFDELKKNNEADIPVEVDFAPTYANMCEFARAANSIIKIQSPVSNPVPKIQNQNQDIPIEMAKLRFKMGNDSLAVTYSDGQLEIPFNFGSELTIDDVVDSDSFREYIIQVFEMAFANDQP